MLLQFIIYLPTIIGIAIIALFTYLKRKDKSIFFFSLFSITAAIWLLLQLFIQLNINNSAIVFFRLTDLASNFLALTFLLFALSYVQKTIKFASKIPTLGLLVLPVLFSLFSFSTMMITSIDVTDIGFAIKEVGTLYYLQLLFIVVYFVFGLVLLTADTFRKSGVERSKNIILLIGLSLAIVLNLIVNTVFATSAYTQLVVPISIFVMVAIIAYAIIRRQLFDIRLVAVRAVTYSLTILIIGIIYGFVAFSLIARVFSGLNPTAQQVLDTILAVALAFTFQPIRRFFERLTTNIFYRDHYDAQTLVNEVGRILASEIDLDKVSNCLLKELQKQMKIDKGEIVIFGEKQLFYENNVFKVGEEQISPKELQKLGRVLAVADDMEGGERKELMQKYGLAISLALRTSEDFIGYLLLGEKKSGDIYTAEDLRVLRIIAQEVSVAMSNALKFKEIQEFSETLAAKVRERTGQLRHANDQLKDLDKAKDEFISMASHQLRTPLTTVKGYASMLEEGDFGKLSKEQKGTVSLTLDGANRMARLIDDLLNVSRMDANRFFLDGNQVDLGKLVPEELTQLQTFADSKKVELKYIAPKAKIPIITLDETKTRQVVMNLVDNAVHYSSPPAGGGHVAVSMELSGNWVVFRVVDDGIGVPMVAQKQMFTKMFRASNAQSVRPDGTGLGLYLVKRVVEEQGGEIIFESVEGKGSTFGFKLPLSGIPKEVLEQSKKIGARVAASHKS